MKKRRADKAQIERRRTKRERNKPLKMAWRIYLKKEIVYGTRATSRAMQV